MILKARLANKNKITIFVVSDISYKAVSNERTDSLP